MIPSVSDCVLLGAAILGACASQDYNSIEVKNKNNAHCLGPSFDMQFSSFVYHLQCAMNSMGGEGTVLQPNGNQKM